MTSRSSRRSTTASLSSSNRIDVRKKFRSGLSLNQKLHLASELEDNGNQAGFQTFQKLKASAGRARKRTEETSDKLVWIEEYKKLNEQQMKVEKSLSNVLNKWSNEDPNILEDDVAASRATTGSDAASLAAQKNYHKDDGGQGKDLLGEETENIFTLNGLLSCVRRSKTRREESKQAFKQQLAQAEDIVRKVSGPETNSSEDTEILNHIVDNVLHQLREEISGISDYLRQEETNTTKTISYHRHQYFSEEKDEKNVDSNSPASLETDDQLHAMLRNNGAENCPDIGVVEEGLQRLIEKRDKYTHNIMALRKEIENAERALKAINENENEGSMDDFKLVYVKWKKYFEESQQQRAKSGRTLRGGMALPRTKMIENIAKQTNRSLQAIENYDRWSETVKSRSRDVEDQKKQWERERSDILEDIKKAISDAIDRDEDMSRREREAHERMKVAHKKHKQLRKMRQQQIQERLVSMQTEVSEKMEEEQQRIREQEKAENHAEKLRRKVQEHRHEEAERKAQIEKDREEQEAKKREQLKEEIERSKPKIRARYEELEKKYEAKQLEKEVERRRLKEQEERLEDLRKEVPYFEKLQDIQADSDRVQSHTTNSFMASELGIAHAIFVQKQHEQDKANESALNEKVLESRNRLLGTEPISYGPGRSIVGQSTMNGSFAESKTVAEARKGTMDKALAAYRLSQRGHFHKSGFDDKTVMSDMRFKITSALHSAGLANSSYASDVLAKFAKPVPKAQQAQFDWRGS